MGQILPFANPIAGHGAGAVVARELEKCLAGHGYPVRTFLSRADATSFHLGQQEVEAAIIVGGDGTLRGVTQWAIGQALAGQSAAAPGSQEACLPFPLLVIPAGTANLMGQHLRLNWDRQNLGPMVLAALRKRHIVHVDAATSTQGIFLLMAGVGFDGWIIHELDRLRRGPISLGSYVVPTIKALAGFRFPQVSVSLDGKCIFERGQAMVMVANIPEYGTGFPLLPHARSNDRLLDVCVMPCGSRIELAQLFLAAATGELAHREGVICQRGKHVQIQSPQPVAVQMDGEPAGSTPLTIDLLPGRIGFIVPHPL